MAQVEEPAVKVLYHTGCGGELTYSVEPSPVPVEANEFKSAVIAHITSRLYVGWECQKCGKVHYVNLPPAFFTRGDHGEEDVRRRGRNFPRP